MKLITGGAYQGKLAYALAETGLSAEHAADGGTCTKEEMFHSPVVDHFHLFIKRMLKEGMSPEDLAALAGDLLRDNPDAVIITDELGCGLVPVDAFDRSYREVTGRICCLLAREAEEVHRVICGIGTVIKHG